MSNYKNIKKLGLAIIAFEGTEHLYNIISSIRESVDYVSIGLLRLSYHGDRISEVDLLEIFRLRDEDHLVDSIIEIELDTTKAPREQETDKRNILIQDAEDNGCSHCLVIDSDEYYVKKSFDNALKEIDEHDYEITYCQYVNYVYSYQFYLKYPFLQGMYVPFVTKVKYRHSFDCLDFNKPSDPTRRFVRPYDRIDKTIDANGNPREIKHYTVDYHIFEWEELKMHHLSWIRADIRKKLENWSSKKVFDNYDDLIDQAVYNFEHFDEAKMLQSIKMLFHTPENKVEAVKFPRQYIHPSVDIHTRLKTVKEYKKMLFLTMSADMSPFNELEDACNNTWRNVDTEKYHNIDAQFWTYTDAPKGKDTYIDEQKHIIYIKRDDKQKDLINATYSKTIEAFHIIREKLNLLFDYLIRTNNSVWVNVPLVNEFLSYCNDDSKFYSSGLYAAYWSAFNIYMGGLFMMFSKRNVDILLRYAGSVEDAKKYERRIVSCDDNMICGKLNERNIKLGLPYNYVYHSLGSCELPEKTFNDSDVMSFDYVHYQIKTFDADIKDRKIYDILKMYRVNDLWKLNNADIEDIYLRMMKHYDEVVYVMGYSKAQMLKMSPKVISKMRIDSALSREEALKFLIGFLQKCGYQKGLFV